MKTRVVVVGLGRVWQETRNIIAQRFEVAALSDNYYSDVVTEKDGFRYIPLHMLKSDPEAKYLITTTAFYWNMRFDLIRKAGIREEMILDEFFIEELLIDSKRAGRDEDLKRYERDKETYIKLEQTGAHPGKWKFSEDEQAPFLDESRCAASSFPDFYFWMEEWCAKKIYAARPALHVDIGGRYDGFISRLNTFGQKVTYIDIRPMESPCENVEFIRSDAATLSEFADGSVCSLSAMGIIENTGFGRWGDPVDPDGWYKCLMSMQRVLAKDGDFYLCVPIGREVLQFNARRVFEPQTIIDTMSGMRLMEFAMIDPTGKNGWYLQSGGGSAAWIREHYAAEENTWSRQLRGCFWFQKN